MDREILMFLSGPSKARRLACLESLKQDETINPIVLKILTSIENVPLTLTEYRDKERFLEDLLKALSNDGPTQSEETQVVAASYLLGSLYINFEKFWGPTIRVIIALFNESRFQYRLLNILLDHLKFTNDIIYNEAEIDLQCSTEDRPDHVLHRNFILQLLARFIDFVEQNNVILMDQLFRFFKKEMLVSPFIERSTRDDLVKKPSSVEDKNVSVEIGTNQPKSKKLFKKSPVSEIVSQKRKSRETFITATKIIQSLKNIKVYRYTELNELLLDLLCCRDSSIQKAAFNCILAYDNDHLKPYIDKILKIINDKSSRAELTMFSVDAEETNQVLDEHRAQLMPILLRIVYGKMIGRIGKKSSGKNKADVRKNLVMRFIAGCTESEIEFFFGLMFDPIYKFVGVPYEQLAHKIERERDLHNYVPLNKLQAMLGSLNAFISSVAHLKEESLHLVMKLINIIIYHVVIPLTDNELANQIIPGSIEALKVLRRGCVNIVAEFFRSFEYYCYKQYEIDFIFEHLVWTSTRGFIDKNYASPTPLLKLIETFASNRVYHKLLIKRNKLDGDEYLLHHVVNLFCDAKTKRPMLKYVASIFASIINPDRNSQEENELDELPQDLPMLQDDDAMVPQYDKSLYKIDENLPFNHEILISFIPVIFERLKSNCQDFVNTKDSKYRIENDELLILSTLSEFLKNSDQSMLGSKLLLTTLQCQKKGELILNTLKTIQVLMKQVDSGIDFTIVSAIANLLSYQHNFEQRKELCILLEILANIDDNLKSTCEIILKMNATSQEMIGSPDLVKWNEGFQLAFKYIRGLDRKSINRPEVVKSSFTLLLHQICFIINNIDRYEFSIRENCSLFYEMFAAKLKLLDENQNEKLINEILSEILLEKFVKKGIRETNDMIKHSYIDILRSLAMHCHAKNKTLKELSLFCNENQDLDFWLNIKHIQLHNRSKALARLIASEEINQISPKTLSSYFMPIAGGFLYSKTYKSVSSLTENSIKLIGIVCMRLNWITYESTLNYYLGLLTKANATYQRTTIKLITEILKNFNFDITACEEAMQYDKENKKLEMRMKKRLGPDERSHQSAISTDAPSGKKLNPSTARMIYYSVTKKLLPRLNSLLHEMTHVELENDKNMSNYLPVKEEIKRIPIAYAIVQLLNLLPGRYILFREHLPSLFLKLSSFLKSKDEQVRKAARLIVVKIMSFVGPVYMPDLLRILKQNLDKGFQIHVLNYTIHSVLDKLPLRYGDLDHSAHELVDSCFQEIFGKLAEDKEVSQILAKTFEAKKTKSYDTMLILSSYISAAKLDYLMNSVKEVLKTSSEAKKVDKLTICVQKIFVGLAKNDGFPLDKLLTFIESTIKESIPNLKVRQTVDQADRLASDSKTPLRKDRFLIQKDLPRDRIKSKINAKGNFHIVVENCLRLLLNTFENNRVVLKRKQTLRTKLDGFIGILSACLKSSSPKCVMRSLKCIHFIAQIKADLPSFKLKCNSIVKKLFIILSQYNGVGMVQGDNLEMIQMCFKTITLLLLKCEHIQLTDLQIRALMTYIEQDLYDTSRQVTTFEVLHSLLKKKCDSPELLDIMVKIADLLVTSDDDTARSLSIKIWETYLLEYKHEGEKLQVHLTRFLRQLDYEFIDGRKSVLKILTIIVTKFPEVVLRNYFELMFHLLAQRVLNEESREVRASVGRLIALLIQRLPDQQSYLFNKFVIQWASVDNAGLKLLGIKLISIFVEANKSAFDKDRERVKKVLAIISATIDWSEISPELHSENTDPEQDIKQEESLKLPKVYDKLSYHSLRLLKRLLDKDLVGFIESRYMIHLKKIWHSIAAHMLKHRQLNVVLTSCELYLAFIKNTDLSTALNVQEPTTDNYLEWNARQIVRSLCDNFIDLLDRASESNQLLGLITEGLILLGRLVANSSSTLNFELQYMNSFKNNDILGYFASENELPDNGFSQDNLPYKVNEAKKRLDLLWLSLKVVMQARKEAALYRLIQSYRRKFVLQWTAAISQELGPKRIAPYVVLYMMTPTRELTDKGKAKSNEDSLESDILPMAEDLLKFIKSLINLEAFNKIYSKVQLHFTRKRVERRKKEAVIKVKDQARGVKRKLKQRKDKDVVKRKRAVFIRKNGPIKKRARQSSR